jgi:hypothetical protein
MGKFAKGRSGNPGGRPKTIAVLRELAQDETRPTRVLSLRSETMKRHSMLLASRLRGWLGHARIETTAIHASTIGGEERNPARRTWSSLELAIPDRINLPMYEEMTGIMFPKPTRILSTCRAMKIASRMGLLHQYWVWYSAGFNTEIV